MIKPENQANGVRLAVFDVEGIVLETRVPLLISGGGYLLLGAARRKSLFTLIKFLFISLLYILRLLSTETAVRKAFALLNGLDSSVLREVFNEFVIPVGVKETLRELRKSGIKVALVSYGLPSFLVQSLAADVGAEYAYGVELEVEGGKTTGRIGGVMSRKDGKILALDEICRTEGVSPAECAVIADDRSNCSLFRACGLSIGFNPDRDLSRCASIILESRDISEVLPRILNPLPLVYQVRPFTVHDFSRLLFHMSGLWVPYLGLYLGVRTLLFLIGLITLIYCVSEFLRLQGRNLPIVTRITTYAARRRELRQFVLAPVYFALGIFLALLFFPNSYGFAGIAVLTLGDSTASFIGGFMGRTRLPYNRLKSVEGSLAGLIMGTIGGALFVDVFLAAVGSSVGMLIESLPTPFDDNSVVPIFAGATMYLVALIL